MRAEDRKILFICLGAAFFFWLILNLSQDYSIRKDVHILYQTDPERALVGTMPDSLSAEISGQGWNLIWESIRGGSVEVDIDTRDRENVRLTRVDVEQEVERNLTSGALSVADLDFDGATILTTPLDGKRVPIVSAINVRFEAGYLASGPARFFPDSVTINGATDLIEEITEWPTETLDVERVNSELKRRVKLAEPARGVELSRTVVEYKLPVTAYIQRTFSVPVSIINPPPADSFRVFPEVVQVKAAIAQDRYGILTGSDFRVVADLQRMSASDLSNSVALSLIRLPRGVVSARIYPRSAEYYIYRQ